MKVFIAAVQKNVQGLREAGIELRMTLWDKQVYQLEVNVNRLEAEGIKFDSYASRCDLDITCWDFKM